MHDGTMFVYKPKNKKGVAKIIRKQQNKSFWRFFANMTGIGMMKVV